MSVSINILIVEDSKKDAELALRLLEKSGYKIDHVLVDTPEKLDLALSSKSWDIVIADHKMHGMDSFSALQKVMDKAPDVPFVVLSGDIGEELAVAIMKAGARDCVNKRDLKRLVPVVDREIRQSKIRREQKNAEKEPRKLEWMLAKTHAKSELKDASASYSPADLAAKGSGVIADALGGQAMLDIVEDYKNLLGTSTAVYERNGNCSLKINSGGWCRYLNNATVTGAGKNGGSSPTKNPCHDSCWLNGSKKAIETDGVIDAETACGMRVYAVPVHADGEVVGSVNFCYGDPPRDSDILSRLSADFRKDPATLSKLASEYESRPRFIVELAKDRLQASARLIGLMVERSKLERRVEERTQFLQKMMDSLPLPVFYKDLKGQYIGCNKEFERFYSESRDTIIGKTVYGVAHKEFADFVKDKDRELLESLGAQVYEVKIEDKLGVCHDTIIHKAVFNSLGGKPEGIIGAIVDVTDFKKVQQDILLLAAAVEQAMDGIVVVDIVDGIALFTNRAWALMHGYGDPKELIGKHMSIFHNDAQFQGELLPFIDKVLKNDSHSGKVGHVRKDGTIFQTWMSISLLYDQHGKPSRSIGIVRDITDELALKDQLMQLHKMESIGNLAGGIAHDFNNILQIVNGFSHIVLGNIPADHPQRKNVEEIMKAGKKGAELTRQLLAFSRKQPMKVSRISLNEIIGNMRKMLLRVLGEDIRLDMDMEPGLHPIMGDPGQIEQVVLNLLVNARDAMPAGGLLTITTMNKKVQAADTAGIPGSSEGEYACMCVTDNGVGMDKETMKRIFEPFFTTKGVGKGTGLGLSVVYGIIKQQKGWINVYSEPGQGTSFHIYFPVAEAVFEVETSTQRLRKLLKGAGEKILLVEDEDGVRDLAKVILVECGYHVTAVPSVAAALDAFKKVKGDFDAMVSDVVLKEGNGIELGRKLLEIKPDLRILFTSGYTDEKSRCSLISEKGWGFVGKPFTAEELVGALKEVLKHS